MNDLVERLASVADDTHEEEGKFWTRKFAELIVEECANRLMQDDFGSVKGVMSIAGARLKEHFGLEE